MAKLCHVISPPCGAKEPPPSKGSSSLDREFTPDIRRFQQSVVLLHHKVEYLHHKSHVVIPLDRDFQQKIQDGPNKQDGGP